jgi:hypothetical protein
MTDKQKHWIASPGGVYAMVDGADELKRWTLLYGWAESAEPGSTDRVRLQHPDGFLAELPYESLAEGWAARGWEPGPPQEPLAVADDPRYVDQVAGAPVAQPAQPKTPAAAGKTEEK